MTTTTTRKPRHSPTCTLVSLVILLYLSKSHASFSTSGSECSTDKQCAILHHNSTCIQSTGICSNPFHSGGCLKHYLPNYKRTRICHSDDPPGAQEKGQCIPSPLDYLEVRIHGQNWETSIINSWIIQILLSEVLEVPASVETGGFGYSNDFYNIESRIDYYDFGLDYVDLWNAHEAGGDCRLLKATDASNYEPCAHIFPEIWAEDLPDLSTIRAMEPLYDLGALANQGWYTTLFTVRRDPTLANYVGLQGEQNRHKLAETFKRPTNWKQYCEEVSPVKCSVPDGVATRPPADEWEEGSYFIRDEFMGYFRHTQENNCTLHPLNCTGHFAEYLCDWGSFFSQQSHHLDIALQSSGPEPNGGYQIEHIIQMFDAANATKENFIGMWATPDPTTSRYARTESELTRVNLPTATQQCFDNRINPSTRCEDDSDKRFGSPEGACDNQNFVLKKMMSTALLTYDMTVVEELRSPAYHFLQNHHIDSLQLGQIFQYWFQHDMDDMNLHLREATCHWVAENLDHLTAKPMMIPDTYPRMLQEYNRWEDPLYLFGLIWAIFAAMYTIATAAATYILRKHAAIMLAQWEFLSLLLTGLLLVSMGSAVSLGDPNAVTCMFSEWLVVLGYTMELAPLCMKVMAINRIMMAAKKMRRVKLDKNMLYQYSAGLCGLAIVFLIIWTALDPEQEVGVYSITGAETEDHETIVYVGHHCSSESEVWQVIFFAWQSVMLLCATVLAVQNRKIPQCFNESQVMAFLMYSHCALLLSRIFFFIFKESISLRTASVLRSLSYSTDVILAISIYFIPKLIAKDERLSQARVSMSGVPSGFFSDSAFESSLGPLPARGGAMASGSASLIASITPQRTSRHNTASGGFNPSSSFGEGEQKIEATEETNKLMERMVEMERENDELRQRLNEQSTQLMQLLKKEQCMNATEHAPDLPVAALADPGTKGDKDNVNSSSGGKQEGCCSSNEDSKNDEHGESAPKMHLPDLEDNDS